MIRLTLNAQSDPEIHLFSKSTIILGSDSAIADLTIPDTDILPIHLKIIEQNGFLIITNDTNDPFVSVNGHPFGKKLLNSGDIIMVHQTTILFENLNSSIPVNALTSKKEELTCLLESKIQKQEEFAINGPYPSSGEQRFNPSFSLPFEEEVEALEEVELQNGSIDSFIKELETAQETLKQPVPAQLKTGSTSERKQSISLKDDYLSDLEDENHHGHAGPFSRLKEHSHLYQAWKWIAFFIFSLLFISAAAGTVIYFSVSDKSEAQETKAAQGMADIAMALTHAKLSRLKPHNQNWSDVEFLKTNLQAILPDSSSYASQIDAQGQFNCCPYSLRIYTNSDLSHFLLISQPAPNLLYWLIPQSIIAIDSHHMELRTLKDVRNLNRLLANADPMEGLNGKEISGLIKEGKLIQLSSLAAESNHQEFAPPKNLEWIRPGAENFIYNAPRYFRLGQSIVQQAIALSTTKGSSQEVASLKRDVDNFGWLNHLIIYSDQGMKSAVLTRQGLTMFAPSDKLLFGYLLFNAKGKIHQAHLLKEEEESNESSLAGSSQKNEENLIAFQAAKPGVKEEESALKNTEIQPLIDRNHPIYIQLNALATARENELKPLITALFNLVNQELANPRAQFQVEYQNLSHSYLMANAKHKIALKDSLDALFNQYQEIPIHQFIAFINDLSLEQLIQQDDQKLAVVDENCQQNMESLFTHIENSKSLSELDNIIHIASTWLNFDYIKDPQELMRYQNLLRNHLLEQLEACLLTQKTNFTIKAEDKSLLQDILNQERLIKPEERDFFLGEFDELVQGDDQIADEL